MNIEQLKYIVDIYNTLSFTQTAENFFISHQAVSKSIASLEKEIGEVLFKRTTKGVEFTRCGELIYSFAKDTIDNFEVVLNEIKGITLEREPEIQKITLYIIPRFIKSELNSAINSYQKKHSNVSFQKIFVPAKSIIDDFPKEFAILLSTVTQSKLSSEDYLKVLEEQDLKQEIIISDSLGFCLSKKSPWLEKVLKIAEEIKKGNIDQEEAFELPLLIHNYSLMSSIDRKNTSKYTIVEDFDEQKKMILTGNYICIPTSLEFNKFFSKNSSLQYIPYSSEDYFSYVAIYPRYFEKIFHIFVESLKGALKRQ